MQGLSAEDVWKLIYQHFQQDGAPPLVASPVSLDEETLIERRNTVLGYALAVPVLFFLGPFLLADLLAIRCLEISEEREAQSASSTSHRTFDETNHPQNHMVTLVDVKPGLVRLWTLKSVLWFFEFAGGALQPSGSILGISTIHFVDGFLWTMSGGSCFWLTTMEDGRHTWATSLAARALCSPRFGATRKIFRLAGGCSGKAPGTLNSSHNGLEITISSLWSGILLIRIPQLGTSEKKFL